MTTATLIRGSVARYAALTTHAPVWGWVCYACDRVDVNALTGEDFSLTAAFSWADAMDMAHDHIGRHRAALHQVRP